MRDMYVIYSVHIYKEFMLLSLHGQSKDALAKTKLSGWEYDILYPAYKCNMTDIMAAIGLVQLRRYPSLLARRKEIVQQYEEGIKDILSAGSRVSLDYLVHDNEIYASSRHLFLMRLLGASEEFRNEVIERLAQCGVPANVHYKPLPMLTAYKQMGFDIADYPHAFEMYQNEITLPLHTKLSDEDVQYILDCLREILVK